MSAPTTTTNDSTAPVQPQSFGHNASSILEADSYFEQDEDEELENVDWASITSSIVDYEYENGRRYHAYKAGHYPLPNDERELDRLDLQHHVFTLLIRGELNLAPLENPKKVLDIGTGTGLWAIEFADRNPNTSVIGTDLSPVQPELVPDNVRFEITDIEGDWMMNKNCLDYVHSRIMIGSLSNYQKTMEKAFQYIKPGGYFEIQELDPRITSDDGTHNRSKWNVQLFDELTEASGKYGRPVPRHTDYGNLLRNAGFVDVKEHYFKLPINTWPKNKHLKEIGKYQALHYIEGLEGICIGLFTRVLGWTQAELQVLLAKVRSEIKDKSIHVYQPYCVAYGRKPFPHEVVDADTSSASTSSNEAVQPLGTTTDLRNPESAVNLADMLRQEIPASAAKPLQMHIDCENTQADIFNTMLEADSPSSSHSVNSWI